MARMCRRHSRWTNMPAYRAGSPCPSSRPISERAIRASSNRPLLITSCHATTGERHVQRSHLSLLLHGCVRMTGRELYPAKPELANKHYFACRNCDAWIGCKDGTWEPVGRLADARSEEHTSELQSRMRNSSAV